MRWYHSIYRGPIKHIIETLGLRNEIAKLYARLLWGKGKDKCVTEIENTKLEFKTSNFSEYYRVLYIGESDIISDIINSHDEDKTMLDVGANIGIYTCFVGKNLNKGSVIACEPHPVNYNNLKKNIKLNNINADTKKIALFDQEGEIQFDMKSTTAGEGHGQINTASNNNITKNVDTTYGDILFTNQRFDVPATIKIDVEGAEVNVLAGLKKTLQDPACERLYCEIHPNHLGKYGYSVEELFKMVNNYGFYEQKRFINNENNYMVKFTDQNN